MAKKKKNFDEPKGGDSFIQLFTSLSVILLAFFILLNAMSTVDGNKTKRAMGSLLGSFGSIPGGTYNKTAKGIIDTSSMMLAQEDIDNISSSLQEMIDTYKLSGELNISTKGDDLIFSIQNSLIFKENSDEINKDSYAILNDFVNKLKGVNKSVLIEGHTCPDSFQNTKFKSDWEYTYRRTLSVINYFMNNGIAENKFQLFCMSSNEPILPNDNEFGRSKNQRTNITIVKGMFEKNLVPKAESVDIGGFDLDFDEEEIK